MLVLIDQDLIADLARDPDVTCLICPEKNVIFVAHAIYPDLHTVAITASQ